MAFLSFRNCCYQSSTPYLRGTSCGLLQNPEAESSDRMRPLSETGGTVSWGEKVENDT